MHCENEVKSKMAKNVTLIPFNKTVFIQPERRAINKQTNKQGFTYAVIHLWFNTQT